MSTTQSAELGRSAQSENVERISQSAATVLVKNGFRRTTVSDIAAEAGVGKGTMYLYWHSKDSLVLDLVVREAIDGLTRVRDALEDSKDELTIGLLARLVTIAATRSPLSRYILGNMDRDLTRMLARSASDEDFLSVSDPRSLCSSLLPILRANGLVLTDSPVEDQARVLNAILVGFVSGIMEDEDPSALQERYYDLLESTVNTVLYPAEKPQDAQLLAAAAEISETLARHHDSLSRLRVAM